MKKIFLIMTFISFLCNPGMSQQHSHEGHIHSKGYAAMNDKGAFVSFEFERKDVGENDVLIEILYSGICHSDIHYVYNEWGGTVYPVVPGHEIAGRVLKTGKNVTKFRIGDYAGVGCMINSCGVCDNCKAGKEQFCESKTVFTYNSYDYDGDITYGGYSDNIVVNENFVIKIPQNASMEKVAPLLCAGITTYSPLKSADVKKGDKIAIAGFGGLGHMALQYAVAFGAEVTVFDITDDKKDAALKMGAVKYVNVNNIEDMKDMNNTFGLMLSTIPAHYDVAQYTNMLKLNGELVIVGIPANHTAPSVNINAIPYTRKVSRSLIGGIAETQEMLDYSVENNIYPVVEIIPIQQLNDAYRKVIDGEVHFRYVIDMNSIK